MGKMKGNLETRMVESSKIYSGMATLINAGYDIRDIYQPMIKPLYLEYTGHIPV